MKPELTISSLQRAVAILLIATMAALPSAQASPQSGDARFEPIGEVSAASQLAMRNNVTLHKNDNVNARDVVATNRNGRLRVVLKDGSTLNMGGNTRVTLLRHDRQGRETHVDLAMGTLRTKVIDLKKDGGFFQLTTPHSNLTVVGTDFSVDVNPTRTRVVVYSGIVAVKPRNKETAVNVAAGQSIEVTAAGIGGLQLTSDDVERETIALTRLDGEDMPQSDMVQPASSGITAREGGSNKRRNILIGIGVGAAAAVGVALATRSGDTSGRRRSIPDR